MDSRLSRRHVLGGLTLAALAGVVAACGGAAPPAPTTAPAAAPAAPAAAPPAAGAAPTATAAPAAAPAPAATPTTAPAPAAAAAPAPAGLVVIEELVAQDGWQAPAAVDFTDVVDALNGQIKDAGLQIKVTRIADQVNKIPLMFAAAEKFEFTFDAPWQNMDKYLVNGYLAPLESYFKSFPKLNEAFDDRMRRANIRKGHLYGLPTWGFLHAMGHGYVLREDIMKKHNLPKPKNLVEFAALLEEVKKAEPSITPAASFQRTNWQSERAHAYIVGDENTPGQVVDLDSGTNVVNVWESAPLKTVLTRNRSYVEKGLVPKNIMDTSFDPVKFFETGKAFALTQDLGRYSSDYTQALAANGVTGGVGLFYDLSGLVDGAGFRQAADLKQWNDQIFNAKGNVEATMKFFNWVLTNQDTVDLWTLGIKGKHWFDAPNNTYDPPKGTDPTAIYHRWWYLSGIPMKYHRLPSGLPETDIQILKLKSTWDTKYYIESSLLGFDYDPEPLKTAAAKNLAVSKELGTILLNGQAANVDKALQDINAAFKGAALDEELKGKQAQIDAFVKANPDQIAKYKAALKTTG